MRDHIVFYINGERTTIADEAAVGTLAELLRERRGQVGTKIVCNEGDCGACSVLVGRPTADGRKLHYETLDACIAFPFQLDQTHVVTVEGLSSEDQLSPVQSALVRCHGSQCGFCTPGFVMAIQGIIEAGVERTDAQLRYELSGNLCRCTGYASIIQAIESLDPSALSLLNERYPDQTLLTEFRKLAKDAIKMATPNGYVLIPQTLEQAIEFRRTYPQATLVSGATDYGVFRNHRKIKPGDIIGLSSVRGFSDIYVKDNILSIGGGATWRAIEAFMKDRVPEYHAILKRFGSPQIRNAGTLAGNLASGSPIADSIPFHLVMQAELELRSTRGSRRVPIESFYRGYRQTVLEDDELIAAIHTPLPFPHERIKLYKISKRRDMDISSVTLAMWLRLEGKLIQQARIAIGGVGPIVERMPAAEEILAGRPISEEVFGEAGLAARQAISPWSDVRGTAEYRLQIVENLFRKCFHDLSPPSPRAITIDA